MRFTFEVFQPVYPVVSQWIRDSFTCKRVGFQISLFGHCVFVLWG
jgi:hypothetical protein